MQNAWAKVTEFPPPAYEYVLVHTNTDYEAISIAKWDGEEWLFLFEKDGCGISTTGDNVWGIEKKDIAYWAPLPGFL